MLRATANDADAVLYERAIRQPMENIDHVVVTTGERFEDSGGFQNVEFERSHNVRSTFSIWNTLNIVAGKCHRQRPARKVVRREHAAKLHKEVADCILGFAAPRAIAAPRV